MDLIETTNNSFRHPWELSRSRSILKSIKDLKDTWPVIADIGAGDSFFTSQLCSITDNKVFAVDTEYDGNDSVKNGIIYLNDITMLNDNSIDCMIMMDVLEHIKNEEAFIESALRKLRIGGRLLITVPALQRLFSSHDTFLKHYRRYNRKQIIDLLARHDVHLERDHFFYSSLLIPRLISLVSEKLNLIKNDNSGIGMWKYEENSLFTKIIYYLLLFDFSFHRFLSKTPIRFPGLSLLFIYRKN